MPTKFNKRLLHATRRAVGRSIHEYRAKNKIPLGKLSRLCGLPAFLVDRYEIGGGDINLHELLRIACALNVPLHYLIDSENNGLSLLAARAESWQKEKTLTSRKRVWRWATLTPPPANAHSPAEIPAPASPDLPPPYRR